jgi:peptidoglycan/LPS O-acetylase OafA/YrhL
MQSALKASPSATASAPAEAGIKVFFMTAVFLITRLLLSELESSGRISLKAFYRRRVLRIFPAFCTYWLVVFFLSMSGFLVVSGKDFIRIR